MKSGSIDTQGAATNGPQSDVPMSNVCMLDHTDNGHKNSIHLSIFVASEGHKIVKHLGNKDMMSHDYGKRHSRAKEMPDKHLGNRDMMNHDHGKGYSPAKEIPDGKKINQGAANVYQVDEDPLAIHTNMISHVTDLGNNDTNLPSSRNVFVIAQNPGNGNSLVSKDNAILGVSSKITEPCRLSNLTEECSYSLQKQDSNILLYSKKVKLWRQYIRILKIMPLAWGHSLKRTKWYILKSKSSSKRKSMNLMKHDKRFLT